MYILGMTAYFHNSSAALIKNGVVKIALEEERFSRIKNDSSFPSKSIKYILEREGISLHDINYFVFYEKPLLKFERIMHSILMNTPYGFKQFEYISKKWLNFNLYTKSEIKKSLCEIENVKGIKIHFCDHHTSHASTSYYTSPFKEASLLNVDGVGEWASTSIGHASANAVNICKKIDYPHSLGLLYSVFTHYCGFKINKGEYKLMGLASYGEPLYKDIILDKLINIKNDGGYSLNLDYFSFHNSLNPVAKKMEHLFGHKSRRPHEEITKFHRDIACSIQKVLEIAMLALLKYTKKTYPSDNLCLSGGVALNCVANSKLRSLGLFKNIWINPSPGDSGSAVGSALYLYYNYLNNDFDKCYKYTPYLGSSYSTEKIKEVLERSGLDFKEFSEDDLFDFVSEKISEQKIIGWFQGSMEFGPRALGNRSILADPRNHEMKNILNSSIKFRESFRPFAPVVLEEFSESIFEDNFKSPYMLFTSKMLSSSREKYPSVSHIDGSSRVQTLSLKDNSKFYSLVKRFYKKTGCPILINTSFNVMDEPIVESPDDALRCFESSNIDILVIENFVISK